MPIQDLITAQYRAALAMLGETIEKCPDPLWDNPADANRFWHIAYHALFFTHLYLQPAEKDFVAWTRHRKEYQFLGPVPWPPYHPPRIAEPYTNEELAEYLDFCRREVEIRISALDPEAESGFHWLSFNKLELQFYNIRHIQHHTGQLSDRLRTQQDISIRWVASIPS